VEERLAEFKHPFRPVSGNPRSHEPARGLGENDGGVAGRMICVGVADHDPLAGSDRMVGIHPKSQLRKMKATVPVLEIQS
jgi:hypothetical protein